ncbi:MAG TPA: hypothetical protein VI796_03450 [Candidatus Thermoplasmatota archaeon]|nr:hypothetical protein [Candidatus Thermoplasmatota archaeon]
MAAPAGSEGTLLEALARREAEGYRGQFGVRAAGRVVCFTCRAEQPPGEVTLQALDRFEGASNPDGEAAIASVKCGRCGALGTLVVTYGPEAPIEEAIALKGLRDARRPGVPAKA